MNASAAVEMISHEAMALLSSDRQVEPFSRRFAGFDLAQAYGVVARVAGLRRARGERPVGRKIGFTNRALWSGLGIAAPVWNYIFDRTLHRASHGSARIAIAGMPEARIEPELVLHLARAPAPGMSVDELTACIDWLAPGFEIVFSIFPGWNFTAADAAAAYGVHGALVMGAPLALARGSDGAQTLSNVRVALESESGLRREGQGSNVLGGPVQALRFLVDEIARYPGCPPLGADEIVTTGTLTEAMPLRAGQTWRAKFEGMALEPLQLAID